MDPIIRGPAPFHYLPSHMWYYVEVMNSSQERGSKSTAMNHQVLKMCIKVIFVYIVISLCTVLNCS